MRKVGELVETKKGWVVTAPTHCHHGHRLHPGTYQVVHQPCGGPHRGGHTLWICGECEGIVSHPPTGSSCRILHGAAGVRNL